MKYLMGIDPGTSGVKCLIIDQTGKVVKSVTKTYPLYTPKPAWSEQDPEDWWEGTKQGVRELLDGVPACCSATLQEQRRNRTTSGLIITHTGHILEYVNADRGQVMYHGKLCCEARPRVILDHIANHGYQECLRCLAGDSYGKIMEAPLV